MVVMGVFPTLFSSSFLKVGTQSFPCPIPHPTRPSQQLKDIHTFSPPSPSILMKFPLIIVLKFLGPVIDKRIMTSKGRVKSLTPS